MFPTVVARGIRDAFELIHGIAERAGDATPAWDKGVDSVFAFERRWWQLTYGNKHDKDERPSRDPEYMKETGGLRASATRRGAARQIVDVGPTYMFIGVTHGLATIHEQRGRDVLGEPGASDLDRILERVGEYILTGRT